MLRFYFTCFRWRRKSHNFARRFLERKDREIRHLREPTGVVFPSGGGHGRSVQRDRQTDRRSSQSASSMALVLWLLALAPLLAEANDCTCVPEKFCTTDPPVPSDSCSPGEVCCDPGEAGDGLESRWGGYNGWSWPSQGRGNAQPPANSWWGSGKGQATPPRTGPRPAPAPQNRPGPATLRPVVPRGDGRPMAQQDLLSSHSNSRLLPLKTCGSKSKPNINRGQDTGVGYYTWLVMLSYVFRDGERRSMCTGALINTRYVLTAAHCFKDLEKKGVRLDSVILGEYDVTKDPDCDGDFCSSKQDVKVEQVIAHPQYQQAGNVNDIALVRLAQNVQYSDFINPICLPFTDVRQNDQNSFVAGWGKTETGADSPIKLFVQIPLVNDTYCRDIFKSRYGRTITSQVHFCAGGGSDERDSCSGDSGGPLMTVQKSPDNFNRFVALGIVSFGPRKCGEPGVPGVYTRVFSYVPWILDQLKT